MDTFGIINIFDEMPNLLTSIVQVKILRVFLCPSVCRLGAWVERKYEWSLATTLPERSEI